MSRIFYKTSVTVSFLSEEPINDVAGVHDLAALAERADTGDLVGRCEAVVSETLSPADAAKALSDFGSEPGFFRLAADGADIEDTETD